MLLGPKLRKEQTAAISSLHVKGMSNKDISFQTGWHNTTYCTELDKKCKAAGGGDPPLQL